MNEIPEPVLWKDIDSIEEKMEMMYEAIYQLQRRVEELETNNKPVE